MGSVLVATPRSGEKYRAFVVVVCALTVQMQMRAIWACAALALALVAADDINSIEHIVIWMQEVR